MSAAEKCGHVANVYREVRGQRRTDRMAPPNLHMSGSSRQDISAGRLSKRENILENEAQVKTFH